MSNIKVIVFDFDGVLVDSEEIKRQTLKNYFLEFGEGFAQEIFIHQKETGCNRYEVFDYAAHKLKKDKDWSVLNETKFSKIIFDKIVPMPCSHACESALLYLSKKYPLYISSGTPTKELNKILVAKTMRHLFKDTYGSPDLKIEHFSNIIAKEKVSPEEILFIGDMESDFKTSNYFGLEFLAINYKGNKKKIKEINSLFDIVGYLDKQ